jgi:hypothetical protein
MGPGARSAPNERSYRRKVDTNVIQLALGTLGSTVDFATGDATFCKSCGVAFNILSKDEMNVWKCEFCEASNEIAIDAGEIPVHDTLDYLLEPAPVSSATSSPDDNIIMYVIDTSGSMCVSSEISGNHALRFNQPLGDIEGITAEEMRQLRRFSGNNNKTYISRLQAIQAAVEQNVESLAKSHPSYRVGLITFSADVTIRGDGSSEARIISGDRLQSYEELVSIADKYPIDQPVSESLGRFKHSLNSLETRGATALGPAIVSAVAIASKTRGSKIILATDGLANVGLGSLDFPKTNVEARAAASAFYHQLGNFAAAHGVVIDVIGIEGDCDLENIGQMAELTGGDVNKVKPVEILTNLMPVANVPVAVNVTATMYLHKGLTFRNVATTEAAEVVTNKLIKDIGNVTEDTEVTFEYERNDVDINEGVTELPFQVQLTFTRLDGSKCMRIISKSQRVTDNKESAAAEADFRIMGAHATAACATLAKEGGYEEGLATLASYNKYMQAEAKSAVQAHSAQRFNAVNTPFASSLWGASRDGYADMAEEEMTESARHVRKSARKSERSRDDNLSKEIRQNMKSASKKF